MEDVMNECNVYGAETKTIEQTKRPNLTKEQVELISTLLRVSIVSFDLEKIDELSVCLAVAGEMARKAAIIHRKQQVPWVSMCWAARLPSGTRDMMETQESLQSMLGPLFVDVIRQEHPKRGCGLPNFEAATVFPVGEKVQIEDLSHLSE